MLGRAAPSGHETMKSPHEEVRFIFGPLRAFADRGLIDPMAACALRRHIAEAEEGLRSLVNGETPASKTKLASR